MIYTHNEVDCTHIGYLESIHPRYPLIFNPQTAGGLLASVPATQAQACLTALKAAGYPKATAIGRVLPQGDAVECVSLIGKIGL